MIFSSQDRQSLKIYTKLTNHRNYFAHLNEKKKDFMEIAICICY